MKNEKLKLIRELKPLNYPRYESSLAEIFAKVYKDTVRYCPEKREWLVYRDGIWQVDIDGLFVTERVKEFSILMTEYCAGIKDKDKQEPFARFIAKMGARNFREHIIKDARSVCPISISTFDNKPYLINCINGTYDLRKCEFREHRCTDYLTMCTRFKYQSGQIYDRWNEFISEVAETEDKADYIQRALGYSIIGTTREECMFIIYGKTTRNGKSTLLNAITHLLGDYATVSPVSIVCRNGRTQNAESASPTIASLKGKRFVTMAESSQYGKFDVETIKQLTGGESISTRNLYERQMIFTPQFTMWLSCNELPSVNDNTLFISDRVRVIEFSRHFRASERDIYLKEKFSTNEAMSAIFDWLIQGYKNYRARGLTMSAEMQSVINNYEAENDIVLQFLIENCKRGESINSKELYEVYKNWSKQNGIKPYSAKKFNADVESHSDWYTNIRRTKGYKIYDGLQLKENTNK